MHDIRHTFKYFKSILQCIILILYKYREILKKNFKKQKKIIFPVKNIFCRYSFNYNNNMFHEIFLMSSNNSLY